MTSPLVTLAPPSTRQGPSATLIYNDWYPALRSMTLRGRQLGTTLLMGIPMVLGRRTDGRIFAMRDSCPHRGIPLSCGWFDGQALTCKYHGWAFEPVSGQCQEIPSLTAQDTLDPKKIYATAYPCEERDGYAWVYVPEPGSGRLRADAALPPIPETPKFSQRYRSQHLTADSLQCRSRHHRPDGPGARAFRAPGLVVAQAGIHPREGEALRAHSAGLSHVRACAVRQQRPV